MEDIEKHFSSFQSWLEKNHHENATRIEEEAGLEELQELRQTNEALGLRCLELKKQVQTLQTTMLFINNLDNKENVVNQGNPVKVPDEVLKPILGQIISIPESDLKNPTDANNNPQPTNQIQAIKNINGLKKRPDRKEPILTRRRRKTVGGCLVNPRKFHQCLICGDKHLDYSIKDLKEVKKLK